MATTPNPIQQDAPQAAPAQAAPQAQAPAAAPASQPQQSPDAAPASTDTQSPEASLPENGSKKESKNLSRSFSNLQEKITALADDSGVPRSLTMPHDGSSMSDHIQQIGQALSKIGGATANLLSISHSKYGKGGGATVAHNVDRLRKAILPKDSAPFKAALSAARSFVNDAASLIGETDRSIQIAKSQLDIIGKHNGEGMSVLDAMIALQNVVAAPLQSVARAHSGTKDGGHSAKRRPPRP
jgi:hypothetical protein